MHGDSSGRGRQGTCLRGGSITCPPNPFSHPCGPPTHLHISPPPPSSIRFSHPLFASRAPLPSPKQVRGHFRPEFINRIDEFIIFEPLQLQQIKRIVVLQVWNEGGGVLQVWNEG